MIEWLVVLAPQEDLSSVCCYMRLVFALHLNSQHLLWLLFSRTRTRTRMCAATGC